MAVQADTLTYAQALSLADSARSDFEVWVKRQARAYQSAEGRMQTVTYGAALATGVAVATGIIKADTKRATQGMTSKAWAAQFGVTSSSYGSRVTLWKNLALAIKAGVTPDSETWGLLVAGDRANKNGVRQAIESGKKAVIEKAAKASAAGQKTGLEEKSKRAPRPNAEKAEDDAAKSEIAFTPKNVVPAASTFADVVLGMLGEVSDQDLVSLAHTFTALGEAAEAEGHRRIATRKTAERKPSAGRKAA